jgi:hypothetical protein
MDKRKKTKGQTMIYKQKDKQYNGQKKKDQGTNNDLQTRTNNTMDKRKKTKRQTMIYKQGQTIQWTKEKKKRDKQ